MNSYLIIFIIAILFLLYNTNKTKNEYLLDDKKSGINIWIYQPIINHNYRNNFRYPLKNKEYEIDFFKLSNESIIKNMQYNNCSIHLVNKYNIYNYLPDFPINLRSENKYTEKQALDLMGGMLLYNYGGLWLSPGTICLQVDYSQLFHDILNYDIVTFGSSNNYSCDNNKPDNYIIGSKKNNVIIKEYINRLRKDMTGNIESLHKHVSSEFNALGESIEVYSKNNKHYGCLSNGTYNLYNRKLNLDDYLGKTPIVYNNSKLQFISFPYDLLDIQTDYEWFRFMKEHDILNSGINISYYL